jgi:multiple sugar transport system substrate-binding protein
MKNLKRMVLALVLCSVLVAGTALAQTTTETTTPVASGEKTVLTFCNWGDGTEQKMFESIFQRYMAEHPDVEINYLFIPWGEYMTKLNTMAASGTMPDMGQMIEHSSLLWAEYGMFEDVSDVFNSGAIAPRIDAVSFKGKYGSVLGSSYINEVTVLFYDKDYCDKMGVTVPSDPENAWTWDEFLQACIKLTVDVNGKHPGEEGFDANNIAVYGVSDVSYDIMAMSNGGGIYNRDYTEVWLDKPETIEAIQAVADLRNVYHVSPTSAVRDAIGGGNNPLMTKKIAMHFAGQYCMLWYGDYIKSGELNLGVGVLPKMKELVTTNSGPAVTIFKGCKNVAVAKDLLSYIYKTDNIIDEIHNGLWMPSEAAWYTDPALISRWVDESSIHPQSYKGAIKMAKDYCVPNAFYYLKNTNELNSLLAPLDQVFLGEKTAEEVIKNEIMPNFTPVFQENFE